MSERGARERVWAFKKMPTIVNLNAISVYFWLGFLSKTRMDLALLW